MESGDYRGSLYVNFYSHDMIEHLGLFGSPTVSSATTAIFWQARPPQWWPHQRRATTSAAAAAFYCAKSRQGLDLGRLASRGGPVLRGCPNSKSHVLKGSLLKCAFLPTVY